MKPDTSTLERAIARLQEAVLAHQHDPGHSLIRDGLVHRFEATYDISHKLLRHYLAANPGPPELVSTMNFADLIRIANQHGLLFRDWPRWKAFRDMRARTSHSYDQAVALDVVAGIPCFLDEVRFLCDRLQERLTE